MVDGAVVAFQEATVIDTKNDVFKFFVVVVFVCVHFHL